MGVPCLPNVPANLAYRHQPDNSDTLPRRLCPPQDGQEASSWTGWQLIQVRRLLMAVPGDQQPEPHDSDDGVSDKVRRIRHGSSVESDDGVGTSPLHTEGPRISRWSLSPLLALSPRNMHPKAGGATKGSSRRPARGSVVRDRQHRDRWCLRLRTILAMLLFRGSPARTEFQGII